jgi:hypothetical protein
MSEQMRPSTVPDSSAQGACYVVATGIQTATRTDTTTPAQTVRTVATSLTTGSVSLRYAPRTPTINRRANTTS